MKKHLLLLGFFLILAGSSQAQRDDDRYDREKLESARVAFITTRLDLTPEQAEKFWPIYNAFNESRGKQLHEMSKLGRTKDLNLSEAEAKSRISKKFGIQRQLILDEEKLVKDLSDILSYNQIIQLNEVSRDFARHIWKRRREDNKE
ncbi:hypothetical protein PBT90_07555 [Algoriphagus halophytocola]|uniref:Sensor of ECF-type sigma factor n=1 Tax=Algoriphagus halophytocola TaxID=2991499 RepID=A0ABY6MLI1_9BACT|nr:MULTISPECIES: hypothetical protein [unclassified Algoriphagus]UZD23242.1 hypothetical protein OM944_01870 [Algoriphagus sp. TR-M5]WBL44536.1 hypothetical protein PBT90_07555 [Algoriphagus sp. TR-M9]